MYFCISSLSLLAVLILPLTLVFWIVLLNMFLDIPLFQALFWGNPGKDKEPVSTPRNVKDITTDKSEF